TFAANPLSPGFFRINKANESDIGTLDSNPNFYPHPYDLGIRNSDWPVLRVDIVEAALFAKWLGGKEAHLPSAQQWDQAAGKNETDKEGTPLEGPYGSLKGVKLEPGDFAVNL